MEKNPEETEQEWSKRLVKNEEMLTSQKLREEKGREKRQIWLTLSNAVAVF